jgi:uncharacterized membrane protein YjgN (DUF898 family)
VGFVILMIAAGAFSAFAAIGQARAGGHVNPSAVFRAVAIVYGAAILMGVSIGPAFNALISNLIWSNTRLGEHRIECNMSAWMLIWISVSNFVLIVLTLGLYIPWAMVRLTKYRLESVRVLPASDLQEFVAAEPEAIGAVGEEAAAVFDFDIAL